MREVVRTLSSVSYQSSAKAHESPQDSSSTEDLKTIGRLKEDESKRTRADNTKAWLQGPLSLSRKGCRFELPMDMKLLEKLTPLEYVSNYCRINSRRKTLFRHYFMKNDKDKDGNVNHRELLKALRELYAQSISVQQVNEILHSLGIEKMCKNVTLNMFLAIAAFSERYLYSFLNNTSEYQEEKRTVLEETDFGALRWKLEGCAVSDEMKNILCVL
ncbi:uncharacterized protein LOC116307409 [Actinia tenebrosa]|uniref:Uncharacterized protein LOC116307409 n=1 Tax=Actinia tenebrosa TaxID=6105 RepID=A0A6P8J9H7_ACTTE|nr:uncharacterized protein LOC116307409 [Actinia tenebrosa]XP_031573516.1 uncharacterized protein LOC116307409 [Actinia tenebrosa]